MRLFLCRLNHNYLNVINFTISKKQLKINLYLRKHKEIMKLFCYNL